MITTESPLGEVITYIHNNKLSNVDFIQNDIRNLIDLITFRVDKDGVFKTLNSLKSELFKLKINFINKTETFKEITDDINNNKEVEYDLYNKNK